MSRNFRNIHFGKETLGKPSLKMRSFNGDIVSRNVELSFGNV